MKSITIVILLAAMFPCLLFGKCRTPDETAMYYGAPKEGFYILETVFDSTRYQIKIYGDPLSDANEKKINEWVAKICPKDTNAAM